VLDKQQLFPSGDTRQLQAGSGVHICISEREGFGHYINEARAAGALVVSTDHTPMSELVQDGASGLLVKPSRTGSYTEWQVRVFVRAARVEWWARTSGVDALQVASSVRTDPHSSLPLQPVVLPLLSCPAGPRGLQPPQCVPHTLRHLRSSTEGAGHAPRAAAAVGAAGAAAVPSGQSTVC
jgi:hypothetical protein